MPHASSILGNILDIKYLNKEINYLSLNNSLLKLIKKPYFTRYYKLKPKNIIDIKIMVNKVNNYLNKYNK